MPQPTILLKNRESNQTRAVSPKRVTPSIKEPESSTPQPKQIQKSKSSSVDCKIFIISYYYYPHRKLIA